jgi:hypothetical protein
VDEEEGGSGWGVGRVGAWEGITGCGVRRVDAEEVTTGCGVRLVDAEEAITGCGVRRVDAEEATSLTPPLLTPPLSSKLLRIPYAASVILVAPDDGHIRPKHVELSLLLQ